MEFIGKFGGTKVDGWLKKKQRLPVSDVAEPFAFNSHKTLNTLASMVLGSVFSW